jgi:hypothetical protein
MTDTFDVQGDCRLPIPHSTFDASPVESTTPPALPNGFVPWAWRPN